jgi:hypothetical protein
MRSVDRERVPAVREVLNMAPLIVCLDRLGPGSDRTTVTERFGSVQGPAPFSFRCRPAKLGVPLSGGSNSATH